MIREQQLLFSPSSSSTSSSSSLCPPPPLPLPPIAPHAPFLPASPFAPHAPFLPASPFASLPPLHTTIFPALSCLEPGTYGTKALRATTRLSGQAMKGVGFAYTYSKSGLILSQKNIRDWANCKMLTNICKESSVPLSVCLPFLNGH